MSSSFAVSPSPPLGLAWAKDGSLTVAVAGSNSLYGITSTGKLVGLDGAGGTQRWESSATYLPNRLARQGTRLFAYRLNEGLGYVDDTATGPVERLAMSFGAAPGVNLSTPIVDDSMVYYCVNQGLYATHQTEGFQFGAILSEVTPHTVGLISSREIVTIDGKGIPTRYHVGAAGFEPTWTGESHGKEDAASERLFVIEASRLVLIVGTEMVAYELGTGRIAWRLGNVPAQALTSRGGIIYAAHHGAALWAIDVRSGAILWQRQYIYDISLQLAYGIAVYGDYLYFGGMLQRNPDRTILLAVRAADGGFAWLSRSAGGNWVGGLPVMGDDRLYAYSLYKVGAYQPLSQPPRVSVDDITMSPRPLRGAAAGFGTGSFSVNLPTSARVSAAVYREVEGLGTTIVNNANWSTGQHQVSWSLSGTGGFTDRNQFGYILVDVAEAGGVSYTQALLVPVNTFPDTLWHWARRFVEIMAYHTFIGGYPDQTFKPDGLVTRAESSTIVAKTLGLSAPSPAFQSKFTDVSNHWAKPFILALEERGIIGGFLEPDGTYTFRPDENMTRAQEAKILVKAYNVPPASPTFRTSFTDVADHWARPDIIALEAAGYVNGYKEPDGTFTYRPEQNVTRAEMCAICVRILGLTRSL